MQSIPTSKIFMKENKSNTSKLRQKVKHRRIWFTAAEGAAECPSSTRNRFRRAMEAVAGEEVAVQAEAAEHHNKTTERCPMGSIRAEEEELREQAEDL